MLKQFKILSLATAFIFSLAPCDPIFAVTKTPAKDITVNASVFTKNLTSSETDVQKAFVKIDQLGVKGDKGDAATVNAGTTTTGNPGTNASVINSGTSSAATFDFTIPRGATGAEGSNGTNGTNGQEVLLQKSATHIQWKYASDVSWTDLVALADLKGADGSNGTNGTNGSNGTNGTNGREVELQNSGTYIQWRYAGDVSWTNLVLLSDLKGDAGTNGDPGPNLVGSTTATDLTGILKGNGSKVTTATAGSDYVASESDPVFTSWLSGSPFSGYATETWVSQQGFVTGTPWTLAGYLTSASSLDPSKITQSSTYRFVSDTEKSTWNGKQNAGSYQTASSILSALAGLTYVSGSPRVIMTGAATFGLDSTTYLTSLAGALLATGATTGATSQAQVFTNGVTANGLLTTSWGFSPIGSGATLYQALFRNTQDISDPPNDYANEVHIRLQAGTTTDHREYINFADHTGTDAWLTGRNDANDWILYDANWNHRMYLRDGGNGGASYINSSSTGAVIINGNYIGDATVGTGGLSVQSGGASPYTWFSANSNGIWSTTRSGDNIFILDATTGSSQKEIITFTDGGISKYFIGRHDGGNFRIYDYTNSTYVMDITEATGNVNFSGVISSNSVAVPTISSTSTLTNKTITKKVDSSQTGVTTIATNSDLYDMVYATDTGVAGTLAMSADIGTAQTEGKSLIIQITSTNSQTFSWTGGAKGFVGGTTALPTTTTGSGKTDYYTFIWSVTANAWRYTGTAGGF